MMAGRRDAGMVLCRAERWRADNRDVWRFMEETACNEVAHKRHFGVQWLVEKARRFSFVDRAGDPFRINNSFCPAFARMMLEDHPDWKPYIEVRRSGFDELFTMGADSGADRG